MGLAAIGFIVVFALIVSGGLLLFYREAMVQRVSDVVTPKPKRGQLMETIQQTGSSLRGMVGNLDRMIPKSESEMSVIGKRLVRAGYRNESAIKYLYGAKVLTPTLLLFIAWATGAVTAAPFFALAAAVGVGFLLPDFWLGRRIKQRQKKIRRGLPDALDFLVICIEAGLSIDQATARSAEELKLSHPAISDELEVVVLEQRAGRPRADAWRQFAERCDVDTVRVLATVLIQAEQLGTSVSKRCAYSPIPCAPRGASRSRSRPPKPASSWYSRSYFLSFPPYFLWS